MRAWIVCAALGAASCATTGLGSVEKGVAEVLISPADENKLGLQFKQELEQKQHVVYYNDPIVVNYVRGVADRVITFGKRDRPDVQAARSHHRAHHVTRKEAGGQPERR